MDNGELGIGKDDVFSRTKLPSPLAIDFTTVAHTVDAHNTCLVGNLVNHPVIAHADAPVVFASGQLAAPRSSRMR
jgi:hypothetical protein